jgi:hypothetical protein
VHTEAHVQPHSTAYPGSHQCLSLQCRSIDTIQLIEQCLLASAAQCVGYPNSAADPLSTSALRLFDLQHSAPVMTTDLKIPTMLYTWIGASPKHNMVLTVARLSKPDSYILILRTAPPGGNLSTLRSAVELHFDKLWSTPVTAHTRSIVYIQVNNNIQLAENTREFVRRAFPLHYQRLRWMACIGNMPHAMGVRVDKGMKQSALQYSKQAKVACAFPAEKRDEELAILLWCVKQLKDE